MCARVQNDVLHILRVLRVSVFQLFTCLCKHLLGVLGVRCVLLGLCVLYVPCALYAFSKPYVQHRGLQKHASGQKHTDGSQRNMHISACKYCLPTPPPRHGQLERHVGYPPPTLQNILQHRLYFICSLMCQPFF